MFALCPHCQFLVTVDPRTGQLPPACPGCGKPVDDAGDEASATPDGPAPPTPAATPAAPSPRRVANRKPAADAPNTAATASPAVPKADTASPAETPARRARTKPTTRSHAADDAAPMDDGKPVAATAPAAADGTAASTPQAITGATDDAGAAKTSAESAVPSAPGIADGDNKARDASTPPTHDAAPADDVTSGRATANDAVAAPLDGPVASVDVAPEADEADPGTTPVSESLSEPEHEPEPEPELELDLAPAPEPVPPPAALPGTPPGAAPARAARALPRFLDQRVASPDAPGRRARLLTWSAVGVLSIVLVVQVLLADRARLAADAGWRPVVATLCGAFGCSLPPWREPTAFTMLSRDVHANPARPGTLRVSASFRNDARWAQPWPSLLLTLSDLDGRTAGARVFGPSEYVGEDAPRLLAPGQSANVTLDVMEPAPGIVAFTFDFR